MNDDRYNSNQEKNLDSKSFQEIPQELAKRIRPVMIVGSKEKKHYVKPLNIFSAYMWGESADEARNLTELCDIETYHSYGHRGFFKPSVAEVLVQIPKKYLNKVVAFEIIKHPEHIDDLNQERGVLEQGYHVATTRLYTRK